jgi:hypothetical protein
MNPEILTFLVRSRKISMSVRNERGLWQHPPIRLSKIEHHLAGTLGTERRFPHDCHGHKQGQAVPEGGVIDRKEPSKRIYRGDLDGWRVIE